MRSFKVIDLLDGVQSGEWGNEPDGKNQVKVIRTTNFTNVGILDLSKGLAYRDIEDKKVIQKQLKKGDIIIEKSGGSPQQPVGRVVYFDIDDNDIYLCNNFTSTLRPNKERVDSKYLFYFLYYQHKIRTVEKYQNKTTGIINLKLEKYLNEIEIKLPNIETQKKVVKLLDTSFGLISKRSEQIKILNNLTRSIFYEMFGDPLSKDNKYKKYPLKELGEIKTGNTPSRKKEEYYGDYIEWIKSDNINTPFDFLTVAQEYLSEKGAEKGRIAKEGSILVTCIAGSRESIGSAAIADRDVSFNQQINAITPSNKVNTHFLYYQFVVAKKLVQQASTDGMKGLVSKSKFEEIQFIVPPIEEQNEFSILFQKILLEKELLQKSLLQLKNTYQAIMQSSFENNLDFTGITKSRRDKFVKQL
ncbi:restriction endonuclease subunit S [Bacillus sp. 1P02SD]|uniref:restriction endonuclease subunit S n=1 Tax=Bacillus sp. 1P02SD TaxID=3132264 RepID=UPI0039A21ED0